MELIRKPIPAIDSLFAATAAQVLGGTKRPEQQSATVQRSVLSIHLYKFTHIIYTIDMTQQRPASSSAYQLQRPAFSDVTRCILSVSDPDRIIVFGSHARGDDDTGSDLDILVVMDGIESTRIESIRLRRALRGLMYPIDIIVITPKQLAKYRNIQGVIYQSAINDGKVIYERPVAS
jgi:predicted nucleotidyltransferase